jgi:hypothetical protein
MSDRATLAVVTAALGRVLDADPAILRPDTPLTALGVDSLARVCLTDAIAAAAERTWGQPTLVPESVVAGAATVADLADGLTAARTTGSAGGPPHE